MTEFFKKNKRQAEEIRSLRAENERLKKENELLKQEQNFPKSSGNYPSLFFKQIFDTLPVPMYLVSASDYSVVQSNQLATNGEPDKSGFLPVDNIYRYLYKIDKVVESRKVIVEEVDITSSNGQDQYLELYYVPLIKGEEPIEHIIISIHDVTKYKSKLVEAEGQINTLLDLLHRKTLDLKVAEEKAEEAEKLKSSFLTNLSHEIRTPMNAVIGFSSLLSDHNLACEDKSLYLKQIDESAKTLLNLINDILDIAKIESGQLNFEISHFHLDKLLEDLYCSFMLYREKMNKNHINFILDFPSELKHILVQTDATKLQQVLTNLLKNAFKFTDKGSVTLGVEVNTNSQLQFFIKDTGIGISSEAKHEIFEKFRKIDDNKLKLYGGAGVGLTISKKIIELFGGQIWVESEPLQGATFYFTLPKNSTELENEELKLEAIQGQKFNWPNKNILIVEDNNISYSYLREIFKHTGVELLWAKNGIEAIEYCKIYEHIDLILMDIRMPVMDGIDAKRQIRNFLKNTPIIAQTSFTLLRDKEYLLNAGFDDFIPKFITSNDLLKRVRKYMSVN